MTEPYSPEIECGSAQAWRDYQDELVRTILTRAYERTREFPERLERVGVSLGELKGVSDLARVPVLSKDDLPELQASSPPFGGLLAGDVSDLKRIFVSPGPILDAQLQGRA